MPVVRPALPLRTLATWSRPRPAVTVLLALVLTCAALLGPTSAAVASASDVVARVNGERAEAGLAPLQTSSDLTGVAQRWAERLASSGELAHNPALADEVGGWSSVAENVGTGSDVAVVHGALMGSSGHRANILGSHSQVGAGVASGHGAVWVVQVFRTPSGAATPAPDPEPEPPAEPPADEPAPTRADAPEPERAEAEPQGEDPTESGRGEDPSAPAEPEARESSQDQASRSAPPRAYLVALDVVRAAVVRAHERAVDGPAVGPRGPARLHESLAV